MRIQDWAALLGRGVCEPRGCPVGPRVVILAKEVKLSSLVTAMVTKAPVDAVMTSNGWLGRLWEPGKNELCNWSLNTWFSVPDPSTTSCVV